MFSLYLQLVNEFLQAPPRPPHTFDMGQLLEEMQQIDQQSYRQAPQRGMLSVSVAFRMWVSVQNVFSILSTIYFHLIAPDVAALALSGDWAAEFLSGSDSGSAPGIIALSDAADADWTREFIAEAAGSLILLQFLFLPHYKHTLFHLPLMFLESSSVCNIKFNWHQSSWLEINLLCASMFYLFFLLLTRSWTMGRGISGAVGGEVVAGRPGRQREWMVRPGAGGCG